jgi:cell division protein FtsB
MNVNTKNTIKTFWNHTKFYIITVIITCVLSISGTIYIVKKGSDNKLRDMQTTINQLSINNKQLEDDKTKLRTTVSDLTTESERRQAIINERQGIINSLTVSSGQIGQGLTDARDIIQSTIDRISVLENKISSTGIIY